ncbi:hypothetical protein CPter291_3245 [Collimonas pratensis]|uniref:Uncharacterized protein n=1 Tax=Collimonas pratensis TaxID=279113 RepID=A0ABM5Z8Y9_9BURK|nr:hypothetical protein CPter291_3245 [Collimonas pratensis]
MKTWVKGGDDENGANNDLKNASSLAALQNGSNADLVTADRTI